MTGASAYMKDRPILVLLTSSWISMVGATLVTLAKRKVAEYLSEVEGCRPAWLRVGAYSSQRRWLRTW